MIRQFAWTLLQLAGLLAILLIAMIVVPMLPYGFQTALAIVAILLVVIGVRIRRRLGQRR